MIQCLSLLTFMAFVLFIAIFLISVPIISNRMSGSFTFSTLEETISSSMASSFTNRAIGIVAYSWLKICSSSSSAPIAASAVILTFSCSSIWVFSVKWSSSSLLMKTCSPPVIKISFDLKSLLHWLLALLVHPLFIRF